MLPAWLYPILSVLDAVGFCYSAVQIKLGRSFYTLAILCVGVQFTSSILAFDWVTAIVLGIFLAAVIVFGPKNVSKKRRKES